VPRDIKRWGSQHTTTRGGVPLQLDEQPTNGITYASVLLVGHCELKISNCVSSSSSFSFSCSSSSYSSSSSSSSSSPQSAYGFSA